MSRAFTPPDTMSKEDVKTVADVRRDIWTNGFKGMAIGSLGGYATHNLLKYAQARNMQRTKSATGGAAGGGGGSYMLSNITFNRNTAMLSFMLGGAIGAFVLASAAGRNSVPNLYPIFELGKKQEDRGTRYQRLIDEASRIEEIKEREKRRLQRRKTVHENLLHGHGLSDSHGGHWVPEDENNAEEK